MIAAVTSNGVTNTRCCRYSCLRSWWWVMLPPETCRAGSRNNKLCNVASCWIYIRILEYCWWTSSQNGQWRSRGEYSVFNLRAVWGGWLTSRPGCFTPVNDPVPAVQETGCVPGLVEKGAGNLVATGIRSLYRPARSKSLYLLSYPGPHNTVDMCRSFGVSLSKWEKR